MCTPDVHGRWRQGIGPVAAPPVRNGTTIVTGRDGQVCATATDEVATCHAATHIAMHTISVLGPRRRINASGAHCSPQQMMKHDDESERRRPLCSLEQHNDEARPFAIGFHQRGNVIEDMPHESPFLCWAYLPRTLRLNLGFYS
jgi:hypothetical protein